MGHVRQARQFQIQKCRSTMTLIHMHGTALHGLLAQFYPALVFQTGRLNHVKGIPINKTLLSGRTDPK